MRTVLLASVRVYARRYVAAVLAIVAGTSFVLVTATISATTKAGMLAGLAESYPGVDALTDPVAPERVGRVLALARKVGPATVQADAEVPLQTGGTTLTDAAQIGSVSANPAQRWQHLARGRFPQRPGEALVDADRAREDHLAVGDRIRVGEAGHTADVRIVGLARGSAGPLAATAYLLWPDLRSLGNAVFVEHVLVGGGATPAALLQAGLPKGIGAVSRDDFLQAEAKQLTRKVDAVAVMLLVFAAVAVFVALLVIANTFSVLLAQRQREFALLRCVGATRRDLLRAVRREALVIGLGSATLGVAVGLVLGRLVVAGLHIVLPGIPTARAHVGWRWFVAAWVLGVTVALLASWFPARRGTRVEPLTALRPLGAVDPRTRAGRGRLAIGALCLVGGGAALALAMASGTLPLMLGGGFVSFVGLLLFGPILVPACIRVLGAGPARILGVPGRLAAVNAVRNPRRTAATAASLLVGTTLVTAIVVGTSTIRGSVDKELDVDHPLDATLLFAGRAPAATVARIRAVDGVGATSVLDGVDATVRGRALDPKTGRIEKKVRSFGSIPVLAANDDLPAVVHGDAAMSRPAAGTAYVPWSLLNQVGDQSRITLLHDGHRIQVRPVGTIGIKQVVVSAPTLKRLGGGATTPRAVWVRADDGADADRLTATLAAIARTSDATFDDSLSDRATVDKQLGVMVYAVLALLSVALVIALLGIANTLGLSVLERGREHAMLRALGLTRGQLRGTLAVEAVLLATVTSVIGIVVGTLYAWVGVRTVLDRALIDTGVHVHLPIAQLALVVLVAAVAGLAACVLPARQAARVSPAAGLAME